MARDERKLTAVPAWVLTGLAATLAGQVFWSAQQPTPVARAQDLPTPPSEQVLRLAALGDGVALAKGLMLWLQAFDWQAGSQVPYRELDYARVTTWLTRILALDSGGQYPLMAASRIYADINDLDRVRIMLAFVHENYLADPNRRWPWLAHATLLAKHRLKDLPLARQYAAALQRNTTAPDVPIWVKQMEPFILEDMNELDAARILIGGLLQSGQVKDARDAQLLERRLKALEERLRTGNQR